MLGISNLIENGAYAMPDMLEILLLSDSATIAILCKSQSILTKYSPIPEPSETRCAFFPL